MLQPTSWKLAARTGCKFKVLDLLDSARLEFGQVGRGCRFATFCTGRMFCNQDLQLDLCADSAWADWQEWPDLFCLQDLQLEHIGVAGQPLASELGWFDQCSWCFQPQGLQCWTLDLQCCNILQWPDLLYFQDLQLKPCLTSALGCFQPQGLQNLAR